MIAASLSGKAVAMGMGNVIDHIKAVAVVRISG